MEIMTQTQFTVSNLYEMPDRGGRNELVRGVLTPMSPASTRRRK